MNRNAIPLASALQLSGLTRPNATRAVGGHGLQILLGLLGLAVGFLYYASFRENSPALVQTLVGSRLFTTWNLPAFLRSILSSFPSFIHVFAFSLLTIGIAGRPGIRPCLWISLGWTGVNVLFEGLQGLDHAAFLRFMAALPVRFDPFTAFVVGGVFDMGDVLAAVAGGVVAFVVSAFTNGKGEDHAA